MTTKFSLEVSEFFCSESKDCLSSGCPVVESLAGSLFRMARYRLSDRLKTVLLAAAEVLRFHEMTVTALADEVSRRTGIPYSTVKWNLRSLVQLGLVAGGDNSRRGLKASLTAAGRMLADYLLSQESEP